MVAPKGGFSAIALLLTQELIMSVNSVTKSRRCLDLKKVKVLRQDIFRQLLEAARYP